jgi:predicted protein tyrosine phosphatase
MKILFVCSANHDRSPTAENIYKNHPALEVKSAGTSQYATQPLNSELVQWADAILCMGNQHKAYIKEQFVDIISGKKIDCLNIPDIYHYMQPLLIETITEKTDAWLKKNLVL